MKKLSFKIASGLLLISSAIALSPASATTVALGLIPRGTASTATFSPKAGSFTDIVTFTMKNYKSKIGQVEYIKLFTGSASISNFKAVITGPGGTVFNGTLTDGVAKTLSFIYSPKIKFGSFTATLTGKAAGPTNFGFSILAPTPEPAAWLSMLLGVGMVGFVARRKLMGSGRPSTSLLAI